MRVYELADELKLAPKELMAKAEAELGITFKSHSAAVTPDTATKIRQLLGKKEEKKVKPKAFIVKKAKDKPKVEAAEEAKEEEKAQQPKVAEKAEPKVETVKIIEQPKMKSKLEIVRPAPSSQKVQKQAEEAVKKEVEVVKKPEFERMPDVPSMIKKNFAKKPKVEEEQKKQEDKKEDKKPKEKQGQKDSSAKQPVIRHIISQDIYQNQGLRGKKKKKDKQYKNKEEEQERISKEKAVQQKHKKHKQE